MTTIGELGELGLLRLIRPHLSQSGHEVLVGAGEDDAAAWREPDGSITVATCDTFVEGIHFDLGWMRPEDTGWRAVALTVSDLAAKGAVPTYGLVSVSLPAGWDSKLVEDLYKGLARAAQACGLKLVGGDTTAATVASITVLALGRAAQPPLPRAAARPGWQVAVTGPLGAAGAGLAAAMAGRPLEAAWREAFLSPRPRLREGRVLNAAGLCCGDISDGLLREMDKFAAAAAVGALINVDALPCVAGIEPLDALRSGEEMELVCVGPAAAIAAGAVHLTVVGELTPPGTVAAVDSGGGAVSVPGRGYDHFA